MMCVMHECEPYGHLSINGNALTEPQAARMVGFALPEYRRSLAELDAAGVFSRSASGVIYCRRMVKDEGIRNIRAEAGKLGGNPVLLNKKDNQKDKQTPKQKPTPSSSASSSSSKKATPPAAMPPDLPVSPELWEQFRKVRKKLRADTTEYGEGLLVKELNALVASGADATATVEQSIKRSWRGFFPVDAGRKEGNGADRWWDSEAGTMAKGKEFGIAPHPGEAMNDFRGRVRQRIGQ